MSIKSFKKLTLAVSFAAFAVVAPLLASKTEAVFPGPDATNGKLVYATNYSGNGYKDIKVSNPDGSEPVTLYSDPTATVIGDPVWSPDKTKIAFVINKNGQSHIYTVNGTDSNQTPVALTSGLSESGASDVSWSPEGDYIVYSKAVNNVSNIFVMQDDGTAQEQLTNYTQTDEQAWDPHWSPVLGSKQIVYNTAPSVLSPPDDSDIRTAVINGGYDGLTSDALLAGASYSGPDNTTNRGEYDAQFNADGTRVYFVRKTQGGSYSIGWVLANGTSTEYTTEIENSILGGAVYDPALSPDGTKIAYVRTNNLLAQGVVKIYDIGSASNATLTSSGAEPDWTYTGEGENPPDPTLPDVSVECTVPANANTCTVAIPEFCTDQFQTPPVHGNSVIENGQLTYTNTGSRTEENYVHVRNNGISTAKCNVKIKFAAATGGGIVPAIPKTGLVGGIVGATLAGAIAGGTIYYKEQKNKKQKSLKSEK